MRRTLKYRLRSPLGGLAADLTARVGPAGEPPVPFVQIRGGVRLLLPEPGLYWEDLAWLSFALSLRSEELCARTPDVLCIEITSLDFPLSHYRPEVAGVAMDGWLRAEFDLPDIGVGCRYSGEADPYAFSWGGARAPLPRPRPQGEQ